MDSPAKAAAAPENEKKPDVQATAAAEASARSLCIATGMMISAVTMVLPSRPAVILAIKGDRAAHTMGKMSAAAAVVELLVNPLLGRLCDHHGRKPFMLMAMVSNTFLRAMSTSMQQSIVAQFVDRMLSGAMIFAFQAPAAVAMADLFAKDAIKLGTWSARRDTVCGSYVLCHIYVGHNPQRDDMMACTYHNMRPLGVFKRVLKKPLDTGEESQPHWGRCVCYFFSGLIIEGIVLGIFVIFHNFHCVFIGQMIATILWAMAVRNYAPRLLGKAFWFTFVFFILLTVGLLLGTLAQTKAGPEVQEANTDRLKPLAYGPDAKEYGQDEDFNGLPLHFELSPWAPGPGYPVCKAYWGFPGSTQVNSLSILDLAVLAFSSSMWDEPAIRRGLGNMLNGTVLEDFELLEVEDPRTVGRWIVISFPKLKLRVLSVRGTSSVQDAYADLKLYSSVAVLQFMAILTPVLSLMPVAVTRRLVKSEVSNALFGTKDLWGPLEHAAAKHKKAAREKGEILILTGHSLGGALVGAVSSRVAVDGIGFSPPGLYYQVLKYHVELKDLYDSFTVIQPSNDVVPRVDKQRGMIEWIDCDEDPATCHRLTHTACELWVKCGDERKRDWRSVCSEWYSKSDVNLATDVP